MQRTMTSSFGENSFHLDYTWKNLTYSVQVDGKPKEILRGMTGAARASRTLAVMGASGAGKTTLLNALSQRLLKDGTHKLGGEIRLNDIEMSEKYKKMIAFVTQDDIVFPMSTPSEALYFSVRVRRGTNEEAARQRVDEVLNELGLWNARDTISGVPGLVKGLSGGERKRTNIGVELITDPKVMLLDEPTSGLDSITAANVVEQLRDLSRNGRTVIYTIHQPNADCVNAFDDIMLMVKGQACYHGPMEEAVGYFESIGFPCPDTYTPTDYFMVLMQDESLQDMLLESWQKRVAAIDYKGHAYTSVYVADSAAADAPHSIAVKPYTMSSESTLSPVHERVGTSAFLDKFVAGHGASLPVQFQMLMRRARGNVFRDAQYIGTILLQAIVFGVVAGAMFVNLKDDFEGVQDRMGLLFMVATNKAFSSVMGVIHTFPKERAVFIREQQSGAYSVVAYFVTKSIAEFPIVMLAVVLESLLIYFIAGLRLSAGSFFYFVAICFAVVQVGTGLGLWISAAIDDYLVSSAFAPMVVIPMVLTGGLVGSTDRIHPYWVWLEKISMVRYGTVLLVHNEFEGLDSIACNEAKFSAEACARAPRNGFEAMDQYELDNTEHQGWIQWVGLVAMFIVVRIGVIFTLKRIGSRKV